MFPVYFDIRLFLFFAGWWNSGRGCFDSVRFMDKVYYFVTNGAAYERLTIAM